jgi:hypothetical protein
LKSEFEIYTSTVNINFHYKNTFVVHEILWLHSIYENTIKIVNNEFTVQRVCLCTSIGLIMFLKILC